MQAVILHGTEVLPVTITVNAGAPRQAHEIAIHGLTKTSNIETSYRVQAALRVLDIRDQPRVSVRIDTAVRPSFTSAALDLPILFAVLQYLGRLAVNEDLLPYGELALNGAIRPVRGVFQAAEYAAQNGRTLIVGSGTSLHFLALSGTRVGVFANIRDLLEHLERGIEIKTVSTTRPADTYAPQLAELPPILQDVARRVATSVQEGHRVLLVGRPGSGRTMVARRIPGLLGPLEGELEREAARNYSAAGLDRPFARPFRAPHCSISAPALFGGTYVGEVGLAHGGVLFLDELEEWRVALLQELASVVRSPKTSVRVSYSNTIVTFPCDFRLVGAARESSRALRDLFDVSIEMPEVSADR